MKKIDAILNREQEKYLALINKLSMRLHCWQQVMLLYT